MHKITFEDYRKAIIKKYEIEKEGVYFNFLMPPSQANLRKLCWERFKANESKDDLSVFSSFFEFEFDREKKNSFNDQTDRFRPIGSFLKGDKVPSNRYAVELAAILVDYQPRPFKKFKERGIVLIEEPIGSPKIPFVFIKNSDNEQESEIEKKNEEEESNKDEEEESNKDEDSKYDSDALLANNNHDSQLQYFSNVKQKILIRLKRKIKLTAIGLAILLCLGFVLIYSTFWHKGCMQWNIDHYDIVDCDLKTPDNNIVLLDPTVVNLRKLKLCKDSTFFRNGKPSVFYAKFGDSIQCFNQIAPHPETTKYLKPITHYMISTYVNRCK